MKRLILGLAVVTAWATASDCYGGITVGSAAGLDVEDVESMDHGVAYSTLGNPTMALSFGEKLVGQVRTLHPNGFEEISGVPTVPLALDSSVSPNDGVLVWDRPASSNVIAGLVSAGQGYDVGEGALTVLYGVDQRVIGFDVANGNADQFDIQFFDRAGGLLDGYTVTMPGAPSSTPQPWVFSSDQTNIAAITIDLAGRNTGGGLFDNFRFVSLPEPSALTLAGLGLLGLLGFARRNRRHSLWKDGSTTG